MSVDHTDLLERATPEQVPPLDYERLARRGRRRRRVRYAGGGTAVVVLVAAGAVALGPGRSPVAVEVSGDGAPSSSSASEVAQRPPSEPEVAPPADSPSGPVGEWGQVAALEQGRNDAFADTTTDGRLVVYGGTTGLDGPPARDGVVIDPATGASAPIPAPPVGDRPFPWTALAADRLLVFGGNDGSPDGAYYDLEAGSWSPIPAVPSGDVAPNVRAWDGTTLIVGDTYRMAEPAVGNLALWQWSVGDAAWTPVPDGPLDAGDLHTAFGDGRLAVWIEPVEDTPDVHMERPHLAPDATDGQTRLAVYDLAAGTWTAVPRADLPRTDRATLAWQDDDLVVVPMPAYGHAEESGDDSEDGVAIADPVRFAGDTWDPTPLAAIPDDLQHPFLGVHIGTGPTVTTSDAPVVATTGTLAAALLPDGTWTDPVTAGGGPATASRIERVGDTLVALDSPWALDAALTAAVWTGGEWQAVADPDTGARGLMATAGDDDSLYLVGGASLRSPAPGEEPDAQPSEDGEPGPYVIDVHADVLRLSLERP